MTSTSESNRKVDGNARLSQQSSLSSLPLVTITMQELYDSPTYSSNEDTMLINSSSNNEYAPVNGLYKLLIQNDEKRIRSDSIIGLPPSSYSCDLDELSLIARANDDVFPALYASNSYSLSDEARFPGDLFDRVSFATELQRVEACGHYSSSTAENRSKKPPPMDIQSIDFFGSGDVIKQLISLPYTHDHGSNIFAFHRMGNALLMDSITGSSDRNNDPNSFDSFFEDNRGSYVKRRQRDESLILNLISSSPASRKILSTMPESSTTIDSVVNSNFQTAAITNSDHRTRSELSATGTLPVSFMADRDSSVSISEFLGSGIHSESVSEKSVVAIESPNSPPPDFWMPSDSVPSPPKQIVKWNLHDMKLAVGTDLTLFKTPDQRIITLNSIDTTQAFELSTCLDLYLDNVMANVPELALALHTKGFVRGLRVCKTKDIPYLSSESLIDSLMMDSNQSSPLLKPTVFGQESLLFDPKIIDSDATAILRFLKTACNREDGTYILTKSAHGQSLQLFDLGAATGMQQKQFKWMLAMISYRFAVRLGHLQQLGVTTTVSRIQLRHRQMKLFETCYKILDEIKHLCDPSVDRHGSEQYGTIRAAVLEQMADCYLSRIAVVANNEADSVKGKKTGGDANERNESDSNDHNENSINDDVDEEEFDYLGSCYCSVKHLMDAVSCLEPLISREYLNERDELLQEQQEEPELLFGRFHNYGPPALDGLDQLPTLPITESLLQGKKGNLLDLMEQITGAVHKLIRAVRCIVLDRIKNTRVSEALEIIYAIVPSLNTWTRCRYALYREPRDVSTSAPPKSGINELKSSRISMIYSLPILWNIFGEVCREISKHTGGISLDQDLDVHIFPVSSSNPNLPIPNNRVSVKAKVASVLDSLRAVSICFSSLSLSGAQSTIPTGGISFDKRDLLVLLQQSEVTFITADCDHVNGDGDEDCQNSPTSPISKKHKKKKKKSGMLKYVVTTSQHLSGKESARLLAQQVEKDWWSLVPALASNPSIALRKYFIDEVAHKVASYRSLNDANHSLDSCAILYPLYILHQLITPVILHQQQAEHLQSLLVANSPQRDEEPDSFAYKILSASGIAMAIQMYPQSDLEIASKMAYSFLLGALTHVNQRAQDLLGGSKSDGARGRPKHQLRSPLLAQQQSHSSDNPAKKTASAVEDFLKSFDANLKTVNQTGHQQCNSSFKECIRRLADSCNVIGQRLLSIISFSVSKLSTIGILNLESGIERIQGFISLARSVMRCGVDLFDFVDDSMNASMIRCNICALVRLQIIYMVSHRDDQKSALALNIQKDAITFARIIEPTLLQKCSSQQQQSKAFSAVLHACRSELALLLLSSGVLKRSLLPPNTVSQSMQLYYRDKLLSPLSCATPLNESAAATLPMTGVSSPKASSNEVTVLQSKDTVVLESLYQGLQLFEQLDALRHRASTHFQIGSYYMSTISLSSEVFYHPEICDKLGATASGFDEGMENEKREDRAMMHYREAYHYYVKNDIGPNLVIILIDMCDLYLNSFQTTESNYKIQQLLTSTVGIKDGGKEVEGIYLLPLAGGALQAVIETKLTFCTAVLSRYGNLMEALAGEVISRTLKIFLLLFKLATKGYTSPCPVDLKNIYLNLAQDYKMPELQASTWMDTSPSSASISTSLSTGIRISPSKRIVEVLELLHAHSWINDNFM